MESKPTSYSEWESGLPPEITSDSVWSVRAYRLALFLADLSWHDGGRMMGDKRAIGMVDQLVRAVGSVSTNIEEGFSRGTGRDRARFYEYALGSARESRGWYYKSRQALGKEVTKHRLQLLTEVIKLLLTMVLNQRQSQLREKAPLYRTNTTSTGQIEDDAVSFNEQATVP